MASPEENKALVRRYFEEIESGNLDIVDELFAEEYTTDADLVRTEVTDISRETVKRVWENLLAAFPDLTIESQQLFADGDDVLSIGTWTGTHEGEYRGLSPSGNDVTCEMWSRFTIEAEKIVQVSVQRDNFGLFTQLGMELSVGGYQTLIETAPDPIVITDVDTGRIIETNSAAESLVERPRKEIIGNYQRSLHPPDQRYDDLFKNVAARAQESPVSVGTFDDGSDIELFRDDGSRVLVDIRTQVVSLAERTTLVSIYRDISEQRQREQRMQVLNRILRHNLNNKLSVIQGRAEVLQSKLDGETEAQARTIQETARDLASIGQKARIADNITAVDTTDVSQVSVRGIIDEVVADVSAEYRVHEIETELPEPVVIETDGVAVEIALREAVENAIEHGARADSRDSNGSAGGDQPPVRITLTSDEETEGAEIVVADSGPGIPRHELAVLDEGQETPLTHGSGIGIWLIHWATNAVRGEYSFETTDGGARVTLSVPSLGTTS